MLFFVAMLFISDSMPVYWHDNDNNINMNLYENIHVSLIKAEKQQRDM